MIKKYIVNFNNWVVFLKNFILFNNIDDPIELVKNFIKYGESKSHLDSIFAIKITGSS